MHLQGSSLYIFHYKNPIRRALATMIEFPYFEELIYWLIGINSMLLALDEPIIETEPDHKYTK
jgi:hypothetical protein